MTELNLLQSLSSWARPHVLIYTSICLKFPMNTISLTGDFISILPGSQRFDVFEAHSFRGWSEDFCFGFFFSQHTNRFHGYDVVVITWKHPLKMSDVVLADITL